MSENAGRSARIIIAVEPELKRQIQQCAQRDNRSVSDWLRQVAKHLVTNRDSMSLSEHLRLIREDQ